MLEGNQYISFCISWNVFYLQCTAIYFCFCLKYIEIEKAGHNPTNILTNYIFVWMHANVSS